MTAASKSRAKGGRGSMREWKERLLLSRGAMSEQVRQVRVTHSLLLSFLTASSLFSRRSSLFSSLHALFATSTLPDSQPPSLATFLLFGTCCSLTPTIFFPLSSILQPFKHCPAANFERPTIIIVMSASDVIK